MNIFLSIILSLLFVPAYSQHPNVPIAPRTSNIQPAVLIFQTYGYIDGARLDSLNTQYAAFSRKGSYGIDFIYGQNLQNGKDLFIKDNRGLPLIFLEHCFPAQFLLL